MMFGSHLSIAGGLENALIEAESLRLDCVQIFTKNQRQWKVKPLSDDAIDKWKCRYERSHLGAAVSHASYLINLASPDRTNHRKSTSLFHEELVRCELLNIPCLVVHPGSHMGRGESEGIRRIADSLNSLHEKLPGLKVITCLEVTAGSGTAIGYRLEHLAEIIDQIEQPHRIGVCLDTAHLLAAGYDLTSATGMKTTLRNCRTVLGLDQVKVLHLNDSKTPRGSRVDRHEHIGKGHVALAAFEVLVNMQAFRKTPKILETPKGKTATGRNWDTLNLMRLRRLIHTKSSGKRENHKDGREKA